MTETDFVQFVRILDGLNTAGLTATQIEKLGDFEKVKAVLNRATKCWSDLQPILNKKAPLTEEQISEDLAENGKVETVVSIDLHEVIGRLDDDALDGVLSEISTRATGDVIGLAEIDYDVLFANGNTLYLKVSGQAEDTDEDEDDEEGDVEDAEV